MFGVSWLPFEGRVDSHLFAERLASSAGPGGLARLRVKSRRALTRCVMEVLENRTFLSVDVLTWHYDNTRLGANAAETALTPSDVNTSTFGKLATMATDGYVYAQPLIKTGVSVAGFGTHDLLLVATEHDSVYAFDANGNNPAQGYLWKVSFLTGPAGTTVTTVPSGDVGTSDIVPEIGITGTPVIDPTTNTLYVVAKTKEVTGGTTTYVQRLHAISLSTGADVQTPVVISASVGGATFDALRQNQRPALALINGVVYIGWSSHGDNGTYHGWVIGYNAANISQQVAVFCNTPNGSQGGIWMAGGGLSADSSNNLYFAAGNGTFDANTGGSDYGDSVMKLATTSMSILSYFTPFNQASLSSNDQDMGTSTVMVLPDQSGSVVHELVTADKTGKLYILNRDSLGGFNSSTNNDVSEVTIGVSLHNSLAYFNGTVYVVGDGGHATAYPIVNGLFGAVSSSSSMTFGSNGANGAGGAPSISANGTSNGIVWVSDNFAYSSNGPAVLRAFDASNLGTQLWASNQASGGRDTAGAAVKFTTPVVANGMVYLGGENSVTIWGLLGAATVPAAPTGVKASANGNGEIDLSWLAPSGIVSSYNVYRSTTPGGEGTTPYKTGITATSFADTGLAPGSTFYYTIAAVNSAGTSQQSAEVTATTQTGTTTITQVPLSSFYNLAGIYTDGATFASNAGLDGSGNALSGTLLGSSQLWSGSTFAIGPAGASDVVRGGSGIVVNLPAVQASSLQMLATATNGNQAGQTFTVTYTDNTTATFTQGVSDWFTPQSYPGESTAVTMAYRDTSAGGRDARTFLIYGYTFALNSAKTVKSITLPNNGNVDLVAMDLVGTSGTVTAPAAPTGVQTAANGSSEIDLSWVAPSGPVSSYNVFRSTTPGGEGTTPYRTGISTTTFADTGLPASSTFYYTVAAVNSAGPSPQSAEVFATTTAPSATTPVPLTTFFNQIGIYNDGATFPNTGGLDGSGNALSATLLGTSQTWGGNTYTIGPAGANDVVRGGTGVVINLPSGQFSNLTMLATATNANQPAQTFTVTYTDNTTSTFTQGISDWHTPQNYAGESTAVTMAYRDTFSGGRDARTFYVFGYSFALNSAKTVKSITLPASTNVKVLAMDLVGSSGTVVAPAAPTGVQAAANGSSEIDLSWLAPSGPVSSYSIFRSTTPGGEGTTPYRTGITTTSFADTGLPTISTFYYTVEAMNSAGPSPQSAEVFATTTAASTTTTVPLTGFFNQIGIYNDGATFANTGGLDGSGSALSGTLLGGSQLWSGTTFTIGPAGANDVVRGGAGVVVNLPSGQFSSLKFLATATNANQPAQTFIVTYTDGTTATFSQGISDWHTPQSYAGESTAVTMAYRDEFNGTRDARTFYLYGYTFALNNTKTVKSITLPANTNVKLIAAVLVT